MDTKLALLAVTVLTLAAARLAGPSDAAETPRTKPAATTNNVGYRLLEEDKIMETVAAYRHKTVRVTDQPYLVYWPSKAAMTLCFLPPGLPHSPHGNHWVHVFVTHGATNAMLTGKGTYPEGSIILKQKLLDAAGAQTELYTGMRKRELGYNPELGDWEFFTVDSRARMVTARGKIESCMACHSKYKATDFVTRLYLTTKEDDGGW